MVLPPDRKSPPPPPVKRATRRRYLLPDHWIHVSARTIGGRYAFVPYDESFTRRAWGFVGRAARRYGVEIACFVLLSGHFHALLRARRGDAISCFVQYVKAQLARLTHEHHGTTGTVWDGPFRATNLLDDEAELSWLRYLLAHSVKEGICPDPRQWPGPHSAEHLYSGKPIDAAWLHRAGWDAARRADPGASIDEHLKAVKVRHTPLTAWADRPEAWRDTCRRLIDDIIVEHAERTFLGVRAALAVSPMFVPEVVKRSSCPSFDARGPEADALRRDAYAARREGITEAVLALDLLVRRGKAGLEEEERGLPVGCAWPPLLADALDDRAIIDDFMPPEEEPPGERAAA